MWVRWVFGIKGLDAVRRITSLVFSKTSFIISRNLPSIGTSLGALSSRGTCQSLKGCKEVSRVSVFFLQREDGEG